MIKRRAWIVWAVLTIAGGTPTRAADDQSVDEVLAELGLRRSGTMLVFVQETELATIVHDAAPFIRQHREAAAKIKTLSAQVGAIKATLASLDRELRECRGVLELVLDIDTYNVTVAAKKVIEGRIGAEKSRLADANKSYDEAVAALNAIHQQLADQVAAAKQAAEEIRAKYSSIGNDPDVATALKVIHRTEGKEITLTESPGFVASCKSIEKLEKTIEQLGKL